MKLAALLLLAGCDVFFRASEIEPDAPRGAVIDAVAPTDGLARCTAPPTAHDEDGDGLADVCDPCPANNDNVDRDGDGVGDACDPFPLDPGDRLVFFDGFDGSTAHAWSNAGEWPFVDDAISYSDSSMTGNASVDTTGFVGVANATLDAMFVGYQFDIVNSYFGIQMGLGGSLVDCEISNPSNGLANLTLFQSGTTEGNPLPISVMPQMPFRVVLTHNADTTFTCTASQAGQAMQVTGGASSATATSAGFNAFMTHVSASSIAVLTR